MPGGNQQGQSLATIDKERRIGAALSVGMRIGSSCFADKGFRYWHFDGNSGSGWNEAVNVPGSPLVFWQVAALNLKGMLPRPFFCDIDREAMRRLQVRLRETPVAAASSVLLPGDNEAALDVFAECIRKFENPRFALGSLLVDPNGYYYRTPKGTGAPIGALNWFCREFLRIDITLNLNVRTYQLQSKHQHNVLPPREVLSSLNKAYWLVGRARTKGGRFLQAVGRNTPTGDIKTLQLYRAESEIGQFILDWAEGKRQGELDDVSHISGLPPSSGV